jgi:hypothetical protein
MTEEKAGEIEPIPTHAQQRQALHEHDNPYTTGRPTKYPPEVIDRALLETAANGGNARKAAETLTMIGLPIRHEQISRWRRGRFRKRYEQISSEAGAELREKIARETLELVQNLQETEGRALKQVMAGLSDTNAVEASVILRNLAQSKQVSLTQEGQLRGRSGVVVDVRGLGELTDALVKLGVAEEITDAEVVEED